LERSSDRASIFGYTGKKFTKEFAYKDKLVKLPIKRQATAKKD
jgi:hypothetical protein